MTETRPLAAAAAILAAMVMIGYVDNYVIVIAQAGGLWQFHALRSLMALPLLLGLALAFGWRLRPRRPKAVWARNFFTSAALMLYFASLAFLPITQSVAGLFTAPLFVLLISWAILGEPVGAIRALAAPIGFLGVLIVLRPWSVDVSAWSFLAILSGLLYAVGAIAMRRWCAGETTGAVLGVLFFAMGLWGLLGIAILAAIPFPVPPGPEGFVLRGWVRPGNPFLFWTAVQAVGSLAAMALIIRAYQWGEASFVSVFEYMLLVSVAFWAYLLRGEVPVPGEVIGIALIIGSGAVIAWREGRVRP